MAITIVLLLMAYAVAVVIVSRTRVGPSGPVDLPTAAGLGSAGDEITVATWNLGYGGLGASNEFKVDGGTRYLPRSRAVVGRDVAGIVETAAGFGSDVILFQEVADSGVLNLWTPLASRLGEAMRRRVFWFRPEIQSKFIPWPLRMAHGSAMASALQPDLAENWPFPGEPAPLAGILPRRYALQVLRFRHDGTQWVIANLHLSAFDEDAALRRVQLGAVFDFGLSEFAAGRHVVLGGDWNMALAETHFPATQPESFRFWIREFPHEMLPAGWKIAIDPARPTVRTVEKPWVPGENYTTIIDGFIVSPNVDIAGVETLETDFAHSDHMPVTARFRAPSTGE